MNVLADELIEQAQLGQASQALTRVDDHLAAAPEPHPALLFARAVALHQLGDHRAAAACSGRGAAVATRLGRDGWRATCLGMRAIQNIAGSVDERTGLDETPVLHDLAQAQVALGGDIEDVCERMAAYANLALAYTRLRLYELAVPMHEQVWSSHWPADAAAPEVPAIQQLNLAELELTWAQELLRVRLDDEAQAHLGRALVHAERAEQLAAGAQPQVWAARARVIAGCVLAHGDVPDAGLAMVEAALGELADVGDEHEQQLSAPLVALALARADRRDEGLMLIEQAIQALGPHPDPLLASAAWHAELVLLAPISRGARAGLELAHALSSALWDQRARRLSAAEAVLRLERLKAEHELVSRDSDEDALTGTASRRALDRRLAAVDQQRAGGAEHGLLVVDLDGLKSINDGFGHLVGDVVLRGVGGALAGCVAEGDVVGRWGGDEFVAVIGPGSGAVERVARTMLSAVRGLPWPAGLSVHPSVSIGWARCDGRMSVTQALAAADGAMYVGKRAGGDTVVAAPCAHRPGP
jgi:diguanylate cyclase (GGDEF)-like protein